MLDILEKTKADYEKPHWMVYYDHNDQPTGAKILVGSSRSKKYLAVRKKEMMGVGRLFIRLEKRVRRKQATVKEAEKYDELQTGIIIESMASGLVMDWKGIGTKDETSGKTVKLELTPENISMVLKGNANLMEQIANFADDGINFGELDPDIKEQASGNS